MENCVKVSAGDVRALPARKSPAWLAVPQMSAYSLPLGRSFRTFSAGAQRTKPNAGFRYLLQRGLC
jgi:hypothetical protein